MRNEPQRAYEKPTYVKAHVVLMDIFNLDFQNRSIYRMAFMIIFSLFACKMLGKITFNKLENSTGERSKDGLKVTFDRKLKLEPNKISTKS